MTTPPDILVSTGEAARHLGVSSETVRRWAEEGRVSYQRTPGGHHRFWLKDILSLPYRQQATAPRQEKANAGVK